MILSGFICSLSPDIFVLIIVLKMSLPLIPPESPVELRDCYTNVSPDDYIITKVYDFLWERQLFITRLFNLNADTKGKWLNERLLGYCSLSGKALHLQ